MYIAKALRGILSLRLMTPLTRVAEIRPPAEKVLEKGRQAAERMDTAGSCGTSLLEKTG